MIKNVFSDNARTVLRFLQNGPATAEEIATATGLEKKTVNGVVTAALQRKGLAARREVEGKNGKECYLTAEGMAADPDATVEVEDKKKKAE